MAVEPRACPGRASQGSGGVREAAISGGSPTSYPTTLRAMRSSRACARPASTAASPWGPRPAGARSRPSVGACRPRRLPAGALAPRARASLRRPRRFQSPRRGHRAPRTARSGGEPLPLPPRRGCSASLRGILRPPIAQERLSQDPDGRIRMELRRPWADGRVAAACSPRQRVPPGRPRTCSSTPSISSGASAPSSPRPGPSGDRAPRFRLLPSFAPARLPRARPTSQRRIPQLRAPHRRAAVPTPRARRRPRPTSTGARSPSEPLAPRAPRNLARLASPGESCDETAHPDPRVPALDAPYATRRLPLADVRPVPDASRGAAATPHPSRCRARNRTFFQLRASGRTCAASASVYHTHRE
jgi:hypothetical protein